MKIIRRIISVALLLSMLLCLAACGKAAGPAAPAESSVPVEAEGAPVSSGQSQPGLRYTAEALSKPDGMGEVEAMAIDGGTLYALDKNLSLFSAGLDSLSWTALDPGAPEGYPLYMTVGGGKLYLLMGKDKSAFEDDSFFVIYDLAEKTAQVVEKEPMPDGGRAKSVSYVQDKLLVLSDFGCVCVYSAEGEYIDNYAPEGGFISSIATVDGKPYVTSGGQLCALSIDPLALTPMFPVGEEYASFFPYVSNGELLCVTGDSLSLLDAETGFAESVFKWLDIGFSFVAWPPIGLTLTPAGEFIFADPSDGEIYRLSQTDAPDNRKELIIGVGVGVNGVFLSRAMAIFNMNNPDYIAVRKDFAMEDAAKIPAELATSNDIDVLFLGSSTDNESAFRSVPLKNTLFEDLLPYLDADPELSREDFIPGALEAMLQNGHLYGIVPSVYPSSITAPVSIAEDYTPWNMDAILKLNSELPEGYGLFNTSSEFVLETMLEYACCRFVDKDNTACNFDSEEFVQLLQLCAEAVPYDRSTSDGCALSLGTASVNFGYYREIMNGEFEYLGYPSSDGGQHIFRQSIGPFSIMASSGNKDAAWQFVRILFTPQLQNGEICAFGFPVIESCLDKYLERRMAQDEALTQADIDKYKALMMSCHGFADGGAVYDIALEETNKFLGGGKTAEDAAKSTQSRVSIYLSEQFG